MPWVSERYLCPVVTKATLSSSWLKGASTGVGGFQPMFVAFMSGCRLFGLCDASILVVPKVCE